MKGVRWKWINRERERKERWDGRGGLSRDMQRDINCSSHFSSRVQLSVAGESTPEDAMMKNGK